MPQFLTKIVVEKKEDRLWKLYRELKYQTFADVITVPAGFITDFASVPRLFWSILPPDGRYTGSAIIHDFLYAVQDRSRKEADSIFLEAMKALGVPWWKRRTMWLAVRFGGWIPWNNHARRGTINVEPID